MRIIFIVGAQGTGKSYISTELSKKLNIENIISTDKIRGSLRTNTKRTPETEILHRSSVLTDPVPEAKRPDVRGIKLQAGYLKKYIVAHIEQAKKDNVDIIIEGIHLLPGRIDIDPEIDFTHIILYVRDEEKHKNQICGQGEERSTYKLKNFSRIRNFQDYLIQKAIKEQGKYKIILAESNDHTILEILKNMPKSSIREDTHRHD